MTAEYGAATQLEKIDMLDFADLIAINKFDHRGSLDALRDVRKQYRRNHNLFDTPEDDLPVFGTIASQFNDPGMNELYRAIMDKIVDQTGADLESGFQVTEAMAKRNFIIPPERVRYLSEIVEDSRKYDAFVNDQCAVARQLYQLQGTIDLLRKNIGHETVEVVEPDQGEVGTVKAVAHVQGEPEYLKDLVDLYSTLETRLDPDCRTRLQEWPAMVARYKADKYVFQVRDKVIEQDLYRKSLSHTRIPRVSLPTYRDWGDILRWLLTENLPGFFPFAAGVFPLKRQGEDPTRMFAGEGGPERTNRRFHYVSQGMPAARLSTAFDSVTLYGENPDPRPDIYGKVGNSGVSVATVDDAKKLYSGFDLACPTTSVSMTINGPAPMLLGFFMNAAVDQGCEKYIKAQGLEAEVEKKIAAIYKEKGMPRPTYQGDLPTGNDGLGLMLLGVSGDEVLDRDIYEQIKAEAMSAVRGTVQADILKEDQAQNTCIFSTEFALRMMGDIQQYFIDRQVRNFYSGEHQRLSHRRGGGQSHQSAGVHAGQRLHLRGVLPVAGDARGQLCAQPVVLLQQRHGSRVLGDGAGGAAHLGQGHEEQVRRQRAQPEAEVPHPDLGAQPARPGDRLQRHPDHAAGPVRHLRQLQQPAHQRLRRGHHHAHRGERAAGHGHPDDHQQGAGAGPEREPVAGRLRDRGADRPGGRGGADGVPVDQRARGCAGRHGAHVPAHQDPGRVDVLRAVEAHG